MAFVSISIDNYLKKHLKNNPKTNEKQLRSSLESAIKDFKNGVKCSCGNDIWVIGSASVGNSCFTCITGESFPDKDYEIDSVLKAKASNQNDHKTRAEPELGFYDDDGTAVNLDLLSKPPLCVSCVNNDNPKEELFCNMTRFDQKNESEFKRFAYKNKDE